MVKVVVKGLGLGPCPHKNRDSCQLSSALVSIPLIPEDRCVFSMGLGRHPASSLTLTLCSAVWKQGTGPAALTTTFSGARPEHSQGQVQERSPS